jgi:hypothetical protein
MFATEDLIRMFAPKLAAPGVLRMSETNNGAAQILKCIPEDESAIVWTVQPMIHVSTQTDRYRKLGARGRGRTERTECYVLTCAGGPGVTTPGVAYVAREYFDRFGIEPGMVLHSAHADGTGTLCSPDRTFVAMPMRNDAAAALAALAPAAAAAAESIRAAAAEAAEVKRLHDANVAARKAARAAA